MIYVRGGLAVGMVLIGIVVLVRMFAVGSASVIALLPGLVLGFAMIALGAHRLNLIVRARRAQ